MMNKILDGLKKTKSFDELISENENEEQEEFLRFQNPQGTERRQKCCKFINNDKPLFAYGVENKPKQKICAVVSIFVGVAAILTSIATFITLLATSWIANPPKLKFLAIFISAFCLELALSLALVFCGCYLYRKNTQSQN